VAGVPGTGKTATVQEVMRQLRARMDEGDLPAFRFVEINALRLPSPQHAYVQLYRVSHPYLRLPCRKPVNQHMDSALWHFRDCA
jgi:Cdc6-like AAA superfamily ATPase